MLPFAFCLAMDYVFCDAFAIFLKLKIPFSGLKSFVSPSYIICVEATLSPNFHANLKFNFKFAQKYIKFLKYKYLQEKLKDIAIRIPFGNVFCGN